MIKVCKHALIDGDAKIVTRVLSNLLDNANKYAPRGSSIRLELSEEGGFVIVRVVDEGTGIPPDQRESVFDKYFQIETGAHARPSDGLAFCRIAVEAHGGTIKVEDTTTGCVFRVTLPASPHV